MNENGNGNGGVSWDGYSLKKKREVPEGLWQRCPGCEDTIFSRSIAENLEVCPECGHHFRVKAQERVRQLCDEGTFEELLSDCGPVDALVFTDSVSYKDRLAVHQKKTGLGLLSH